MNQDMQIKRRCAQKGDIRLNRGDLQLFMTILEENNLIKAAGLLYLSPSTAGARLRAMEDELGFELFERKRGVKTALPTPKGQEFARVAAQMLALWNEADQITHSQETPTLSIATVDSFLDYNLSPLYRELVTDHGFSLDIKCYPADMIYSLVSSKQADVGFALYHTICPHVDVVPIMEDEMVLVVPSGADSWWKAACVSNSGSVSSSGPAQESTFPSASVHEAIPLSAPVHEAICPSTPVHEAIHPSSLPPEKELMTGSRFNSNMGWGPEFRLWHDRYINPQVRPLVTASSISILTGFLEGRDYWTIMPATTANGLKAHYPITILPLSPAPPGRTLYMLTHESPSSLSAKNTDIFSRYLRDYLKMHCPEGNLME